MSTFTFATETSSSCSATLEAYQVFAGGAVNTTIVMSAAKFSNKDGGLLAESGGIH